MSEAGRAGHKMSDLHPYRHKHRRADQCEWQMAARKGLAFNVKQDIIVFADKQ